MSVSPADRQTMGFGIRGETDGFVLWPPSTELLLALCSLVENCAGSEPCLTGFRLARSTLRQWTGRKQRKPNYLPGTER